MPWLWHAWHSDIMHSQEERPRPSQSLKLNTIPLNESNCSGLDSPGRRTPLCLPRPSLSSNRIKNNLHADLNFTFSAWLNFGRSKSLRFTLPGKVWKVTKKNSGFISLRSSHCGAHGPVVYLPLPSVVAQGGAWHKSSTLHLKTTGRQPPPPALLCPRLAMGSNGKPLCSQKASLNRGPSAPMPLLRAETGETLKTHLEDGKLKMEKV